MEAIATTTLADTIVSLLPVIAGGLIGVLGGLAGAHYNHRLTTVSSKTADRRTRLEALVTAAFELDLWLKKEENHFLFKASENLEHSPIAKIETLVALYFPALVTQSDALITSVRNYRAWMINGRLEMLRQNLSAPTQEHINGLTTVYTPVLLARSALVKEAQRVMNELMAS